jgi:hypothetical protein
MDHDPCFGAQPGPTGLLLRGLTDFGSGATIVRLDVTGFAAVALSANCRAAGAGNAGPSSIQRSADGDTLSFFFDPPIDPPQGSYFLSIVTDVTAYGQTGETTIHAGMPDGRAFTTKSSSLTRPAENEPAHASP